MDCRLKIPLQISLDGVHADDESVISPSQSDADYRCAGLQVCSVQVCRCAGVEVWRCGAVGFSLGWLGA